ncbi:hypothetical protein Naga_100499g2 [Nannochloropsis gaditana]|uniref:Uncharacterized protein n=1 Tax=Nannochloropsis gaditana TaxID=72520 RepID=W7U080_9STRA|nr:hypothetical protein Naga_100499g2 [Nannochloropsis gaditana]
METHLSDTDTFARSKPSYASSRAGTSERNFNSLPLPMSFVDLTPSSPCRSRSRTSFPSLSMQRAAILRPPSMRPTIPFLGTLSAIHRLSRHGRRGGPIKAYQRAFLVASGQGPCMICWRQSRHRRRNPMKNGSRT